ncbi:hypothetical protein [Gimesia maris]|uniref:hypothetical protein n=1 Tax=Gimesia maris TaxID=122 RepID=UPI0032EC8B35
MPIVAESFSDYSKNDAEDTVSRCNPAKFGAMIVAHVTIIKNKALPEFYLNEKVIVAPWTTFVPTGIHFENLQNNLIDGLTKINSQAEEFSLADHAYVIDLRPVLPTDINNDGLGKYDFESKLTATWPLMPSHFGLEGESIGLSIALAAWAALETKSLRPVIATGSFDGEAKIGSVGGIEEKFRVTAFFKNLLNNECIFLLPRGNNDIPAAHASNPKCFHRFSELITSDFLTDGFDELRSRFGVFGKIDEQEFKVLFPYSELEVSDNDSTGFIQSDLDEINEFLNQLQSRFQQIREGGESNPNGMQILTLPFGESPEQVISVLMHEIRTAWRELKPTELNDGPVILPVNLAEVSVDELDSPVSAIQAALQKTYQVAVSEEALLNKREKQKLIFLVFDRKSDQTSCWDESRFEKQKKLYQLFRQWNHEMKVPLFVVCSDYHHECLWRLETA